TDHSDLPPDLLPTVHPGAQLPGLPPARPPLAHDLHEHLVQRDRHLRRRRLHEARTTTLPRIPVERELAHHQHLPAHLLQVQVHLPGLVRKEPQPHDLVRHPLQHRIVIRCPETDEEQVAPADPARYPLPDPHFRATDALYDDPQRLTPLSPTSPDCAAGPHCSPA